jgi:hypothetical protein
MRMKSLLAAALAVGPVDPRNTFVAPVNSVFVVDNAKGQISM